MAKTAQAREEVRNWVQLCMEKGELPNEPELHHLSESGHKLKHKDWEGRVELKKPEKSRCRSQPVLKEQGHAIDQDEFFGEDDEDSEDDSS